MRNRRTCDALQLRGLSSVHVDYQTHRIRKCIGPNGIAVIQLPALLSRRSGTAFPATCEQPMMTRGDRLTEFEKGIALALAATNATERTIAARLGRSKTAVHNLLVRYHSKNAKEKDGGLPVEDRHPLHRPFCRRCIVTHRRATTPPGPSATSVSVRRVQQLLFTTEYLE